ncbi:MAG: response regulator [Luteimonas sp.]|nr:response regulator [Luteimonas sp.]
MAASLTSDAPRPVPVPAQAPVNILLVDDQPGRLLTYRAILEPLGERLVEAASGEQALKLLMEDEFAVILLDVNMPGMDGFETASLIHQHPRFEKTPIIFVTAVNVGDMDRLRGYKLGAVDYVSVPVIPEILRTKVTVLAELYRKRRELQLANERLATANLALQMEKAQQLQALNASLREANDALAARNAELQREIAERANAEDRLRVADRRKDEFLATLAHELRNPLAPLLNALNIRRLSAPDVEDPLQGMMERQLALLVRLIDDLLDVARITRGKLILRKDMTTLQDVLHSAMETAGPLIESGKHRLHMQLPPQPVAMHADHARLSQVFANLLNNAAKYSDAGSCIEVVGRIEGAFVSVGVRDTGIGLAKEHLEHIFDLFSQADTAIERARGGLGIGLTLVRHLVEMHDGRVSVHSDGPGLGSEFRIDLPVHSGLEIHSRVDVQAAYIAGAFEGKRRALVVDDNRDAADTLAMMLDLMGLQTRRLYGSSGVEDEVSAFAPDVIFLDVGMPGMNGYDLARALRSGGTARRSPLLVAVTGWGQPEDRRRTSDAGFDHHLVKPPELDAIHAICASLTDHGEDLAR